jgi:hypothetical protein
MTFIYNYIVLWSQQVPAVAVLVTLGTRACAAYPLESHERRRVPPIAGVSNQGGLVNVASAAVYPGAHASTASRRLEACGMSGYSGR